jgi:hypothetical protein
MIEALATRDLVQHTEDNTTIYVAEDDYVSDDNERVDPGWGHPEDNVQAGYIEETEDGSDVCVGVYQTRHYWDIGDYVGTFDDFHAALDCLQDELSN